MKHDLFELLNTAIQTNTPVLIVEGKDDPQIYNRIAEKANKTVDIWLVNQIENYSSGCDNVIKCVAELQPKFEEREDNIQRILGIIDRDVRPYREIKANEIDYRSLKGLFVLKYYSFETYFATETNVKKLICKLTHLTPNELDESIVPFITETFTNTKSEIYYLSLEALKNACTENYNSVLGYSDDSVNDDNRRNYLYSLLINKITELNNFAESKSITINDLKQICKGKWYLHIFLNKAIEQIRKLSDKCKNGEIVQCKSCRVENYEDCSYTYKKAYQPQAIYLDVLEYIDEDECTDIINRIKQLN